MAGFAHLEIWSFYLQCLRSRGPLVALGLVLRVHHSFSFKIDIQMWYESGSALFDQSLKGLEFRRVLFVNLPDHLYQLL